MTENIAIELVARSGERTQANIELMAEHRIDIYLNSVLTYKLMCSKEYLEELIIGRLLTEGVIEKYSDIHSLEICPHQKWAKLEIAQVPAKACKCTNTSTAEPYVELTGSCCTENHQLTDIFAKRGMPPKVVKIAYNSETIFKLADIFSEDTYLHALTGGAHSAFLYADDKVVFRCEDLGRHNAIDKVIGYALKNGIDLTKAMLYTSGRVTTDMILKVLWAKIPLMASKAVASSDAVAIGKLFNITLITNCRPNSYKIMCD